MTSISSSSTLEYDVKPQARSFVKTPSKPWPVAVNSVRTPGTKSTGLSFHRSSASSRVRCSGGTSSVCRSTRSRTASRSCRSLPSTIAPSV
eukprot:11127-Alexandrium_andersonii.AAC.1